VWAAVKAGPGGVLGEIVRVMRIVPQRGIMASGADRWNAVQDSATRRASRQSSDPLGRSAGGAWSHTTGAAGGWLSPP
jgi:hypothetical protein